MLGYVVKNSRFNIKSISRPKTGTSGFEVIKWSRLLGLSLCLSPMRMMSWVYVTEIWTEVGLYDWVFVHHCQQISVGLLRWAQDILSPIPQSQLSVLHKGSLDFALLTQTDQHPEM